MVSKKASPAFDTLGLPGRYNSAMSPDITRAIRHEHNATVEAVHLAQAAMHELTVGRDA